MQAGHMFGKGDLCLKAQSLKINCCSEASQASLNTTPFSQHRHDRHLPALSLGRAFHADQGVCKYLHEIQHYHHYQGQGGRNVKRENHETISPHLELHLRVAASGRQHSEEDLHLPKKKAAQKTWGPNS